MIFKFFLSFLFIYNCYSFDKDFKTVNDRVPLEFNQLFESMKILIKTDAEKIRFLGLCKDLDENLGFLKKEHIFLLMKSEVIKNVLEFRHDKVRNFDVTTFLISRLEENYQKKESFLTPFSKWIWRSVMGELIHRQKMELISSKSFNTNNFQGPKLAEAKRFSKYLNYLLPWIDKMDSLEASEFNELTKNVSWTILRHLNERSLLFKRFASDATTESKITIFNIPSKLIELHPEDIKRMQTDSSVLTLKEEAQIEKIEASKEIEKATLDDLGPLSEEVANELDKKAP